MSAHVHMPVCARVCMRVYACARTCARARLRVRVCVVCLRVCEVLLIGRVLLYEIRFVRQ